METKLVINFIGVGAVNLLKLIEELFKEIKRTYEHEVISKRKEDESNNPNYLNAPHPRAPEAIFAEPVREIWPRSESVL
jgi:hypothetical protein